MKRVFLSFALLSVVGLALAYASDYEGATAILRRVEPPPGTAAPGAKDEAAALRADLKTFAEHRASLPPEEATHQWLGLLERQMHPPARSPVGAEPPVQAVDVFRAMPGPEAWPALSAGIAAFDPAGIPAGSSRLAAVRLFAAALRHDELAEWATFDALKATAQKSKAGPVASIRAALINTSDDAARVVAAFQEQLQGDGAGENSGETRLQIPDLARLAGPDRARELLREAFSAPRQSASFTSDEATMKLAREVTLALGDDLKFAPWELAQNLDATELFERLDKKFPVGSNNNNNSYERRKAAGYYLLSLIVRRQPERAAAEALRLGQKTTDDSASVSLPDEALRDLAQRGAAPQVSAFFAALLTQHPELPYWSDYIQAASFAGEIDAVAAKLKERAASDPTDPEVQRSYISALLAANHPEEGANALRAYLVSPAFAASSAASKTGYDAVSELPERAIALGTLLADADLLKAGLDAYVAVAKIRLAAEANHFSYSNEVDNEVTEAFVKAGRGPELESILAGELRRGFETMQKQLAQYQMPVPESVNSYLYSHTRRPLLRLASFYVQTERWSDVVALLDQARAWGARDLAKVLEQPSPRVLFGFAKAFAVTGRKDVALRAVNSLLDQDGGFDPAYALLLELAPDQAEARLDQLFARDRFEERPLIWKAKLHLDRGDLGPAEGFARQAIAIDPSDGEEPRGDRMRAYAVLADVLERENHPQEEIAPLRGAVKAIRLSEDADRFHSAGLLTRAIAMYNEALGFFADAYCIQSRLAVQLSAMGKMEEAEAHYTKAYELMPVSFGRVESHCFGCERAFAGERAQGIAERVFLKLNQSQPEKPQNHYLLAYLREEEDRSEEALTSYREAVRLDPEYLNAWKKIAGLTPSSAERTTANLNILRLDPLGRHSSVNLERITDLPGLWHAQEAAGQMHPSTAERLYPLAASAAALDEAQTHQKSMGSALIGQSTTTYVRGYGRNRAARSPAEAVMQTGVIAGALELLEDSRLMGSSVD